MERISHLKTKAQLPISPTTSGTCFGIRIKWKIGADAEFSDFCRFTEPYEEAEDFQDFKNKTADEWREIMLFRKLTSSRECSQETALVFLACNLDR